MRNNCIDLFSESIPLRFVLVGISDCNQVNKILSEDDDSGGYYQYYVNNDNKTSVS